MDTITFNKKKEELLRKKEKVVNEMNKEAINYANIINQSNSAVSSINEAIKRLQDDCHRIKMQSEINTNIFYSKYLQDNMSHEKQIVEVLSHMIDFENVEVCFLVDCTTSMLPHISEIISFASDVSQKLKTYFDSIKYSFVCYRDYDANERTTVLPLTNDTIFQNFINKIKCEPSRDNCEDVFGGLEEVTNLNWKKATKHFLIHIGNKPCHGKRFHQELFDSYPQGDPRGLDISELIKKLTHLQIEYYFCAMNNSTYKMIDEFNKELAFAKADPIKVVSYQSIKDFTALTEKSFLKSIINTNHESEKRIIKNIQVDVDALLWTPSSLDKFKATHIIGRFFGKLNDLKKYNVSYRYIDIHIRLAANPFTKGSLRYAYAGLMNVGSKKMEIFLNCVFKESISKLNFYNSLQFHKDMVEIQKISVYLANEFNKVSGMCEKVKFVDVDLILINDKEAVYTVEEFVEGDFKKWTNNAGAINELSIAYLLHAFSHWTYEVTNSYLMVTDLQGFKFKNKEYILTDPAITCPSQLNKFSSTNLGEKGIIAFFKSHRCNSFCRKLKLHRSEYQLQDDFFD